MNENITLFLSGVSAEFRSVREELARHLRKRYQVKEQSDFDTGPGTLLEKLEAYIRDECHACIFLVGHQYGAEPHSAEAAETLVKMGREIRRYSYTQWEYLFAMRHNKARYVFVAAPQTEFGTIYDQEAPELATLQKTFVREEIIVKGKDRTPFHSVENLKDHIYALNLEALSYATAHQVELNEENPYVGLRRFEEYDEENFYGRDGLVRQLLDLTSEESLMLVTGHSGSGKSSVLRAGLIPRWRGKYSANAPVLLFHPDDDPFESLYESLGTIGIARKDRNWVREGNADVFNELLLRIPQLQGKPLLIIIDQFEEIFTRVPNDEQERADQFITALIAAHRKSSLSIILGMRDDFYGNLERHRTLCEILDEENRTRRIMRPTESELRAIIEAPAASHGLGFEGELVERILSEIRGQHAGREERRALLPMLQFTLDALWQTEVDSRSILDRVLNISSYEAIGGFSGALQNKIDRFYDELDDDGQQAVQRLFLQLVQFGETDVPVSRSVRRSDLIQNTDAALLDRLISQEKLLIAGGSPEDGDSAMGVELAHEALIDSWSTFRKWIRENQTAIRLHRRLEEEAAAYSKKVESGEKEDKHRNDLWRGSNLARAEEALQDGEFERVGGLTEAASHFLATSRSALEDEVAHLKALVKRSKRRAAVAVSFATIALLGMATAGWFYWQAKAADATADASLTLTFDETYSSSTLLADKYYNEGNLVTAEKFYTKAKISASGLLGQDSQNVDYNQLFIANRLNLAHIYLEMGALDESQHQFDEALTTAKKIAELHPQESKCQRDLVEIYGGLGLLAKKLGKDGRDQAIDHYEKAVSLSDKLLKSEDSIPSDQESSLIYRYSLAKARVRKHSDPHRDAFISNPESEQAYFQYRTGLGFMIMQFKDPGSVVENWELNVEAVLLAEKAGNPALSENPNETIASVYEELVQAQILAEDFSGAISSAKTGLKRKEKLSLIAKLAHAYLLEGQTEKAFALYESHVGQSVEDRDMVWAEVVAADFAEFRSAGIETKMMKTVERVVRTGDLAGDTIRLYAKKLGDTFIEMGDLQAKLRSFEGSLESYQQALDQSEALLAVEAHSEHHDLRLMAFMKKGALYSSWDQSKKSQSSFEQAVIEGEALVGLQPKNSECKRALAHCYRVLGSSASADEAIIHNEKAIALYEEIPPTIENLRILVKMHIGIAATVEGLGNDGRDKAIKHYQKAASVTESIQSDGGLSASDQQMLQFAQDGLLLNQNANLIKEEFYSTPASRSALEYWNEIIRQSIGKYRYVKDWKAVAEQHKLIVGALLVAEENKNPGLSENATEVISAAYKNLVWAQIYARDFSGAIFSGEAGMEKVPKISLAAKLAHAYLLGGETEKAMLLYQKYKGQKLEDRDIVWGKAIVADFIELGAREIRVEQMNEVERMLTNE